LNDFLIGALIVVEEVVGWVLQRRRSLRCGRGSWSSRRDQWFLLIARIHVIIGIPLQALTLPLLSSGQVGDWVILLWLLPCHVYIAVVGWDWSPTSSCFQPLIQRLKSIRRERNLSRSDRLLLLLLLRKGLLADQSL